MDEALQTALREWESFYLLVGTAAATLIGLQFVAYSIAVSELKGSQAYEEETRSYVTPTIYHFGVALVIALLTLAPSWSELLLAVVLALVGVVGLIALRPTGMIISDIVRRRPFGLMDFSSYVLGPLFAYLLLVLAGILMALDFSWSLDLVAITGVLLVGMGVRNSWNFVLWISRHRGDSAKGSE